MRLNRIEIKNFRSIASVTIEFEPRCRILVGINESGKTNILHALSLLDSNRKIAPDDMRTFPPHEAPNQKAYVRFIFSLDKDERTYIYKMALKNVLVNDPAMPILIRNKENLSLTQFVDSITEGLYQVDIRANSRYATCWSLPGDYNIANGWKRPSKACPSNLMLKLHNNEDKAIKSFILLHESSISDIPSEYLENAEVTDLSLNVRVPIVALVEKNLPTCLLWKYSDNNLLPSQISIGAFAGDPATCQPLRHMFLLAGIEDIQEAVNEANAQRNGIRNLLNRVALRATKHMRSVWKEYHGISIVLEPNGPNIDASIKDEHNHYDFSRRSDGFKRFITFLLMISAEVKTKGLVNTLYLHDEPDVSLHPSGARYLRDELIKISETNYVVFSSHSIFMVDRELLRRHLIVEKKAEITTVKEVDESNIVDEEVIYNALGYSIFENLKKINIIFEGWRDKRLCQIALKNIPAKYKKLKGRFSEVGMCHARGAKDIGRITPMLELANRKWIIVSDGDRPAIEQQRLYKGDGPWLRYDELITGEIAVTGEDFLKSEALHPHLEAIKSEKTQLGEFDITLLSSSHPKIEVIRRWLTDGGLGTEEVRTLLESLKERIFNELEGSHIEEKYYSMLANLAAKFP